MNIGKTIKELRESKGYTQKQLAAILHIEQHTLSNYENLKREIPEHILEQLSEIFEVEMSVRKEYTVKDKNQKKVLVGCINNSMAKSYTISARFFLVTKDDIVDVTEKLCKGVKDITHYEFENGLANYSFGCGLSHYLQEHNFDKVTTLDLSNTKLEMLTLDDLRHIVEVKNAFDPKIQENLMEFVRRRHRL